MASLPVCLRVIHTAAGGEIWTCCRWRAGSVLLTLDLWTVLSEVHYLVKVLWEDSGGDYRKHQS